MRILIIEDDPEICNFLKHNLEAEGFVVDAIADGEKGSYIARTNDHDLIILDYMLPKKDGLTICRELRASGKVIPILMLTVRSEIADKVRLLESGADDYLTKPFSFSELLARVRTILRRPKTNENNPLNFEGITLDSNKQTVLRGKKEVYLTRKEFLLLEYFMRNIGTVLSRGLILEHVWNVEADPFSNTIESHILNLRRKIDTGKKKLIHTVPGRGYKMDRMR